MTDSALTTGTDLDSPNSLETLANGWLTLPALADATGQTVSAVRLLIREGKLVAVRRGEPSVLSVPAELVRDGELVKGLAGTLTVLHDVGLREENALRWLLSYDDVLGVRPVELLAAGRHTAVKRRAMALA